MQDVKHELTKEAMAAQRLIAAYKEYLGDDDQSIADTIEGETGLFEIVDAARQQFREIGQGIGVPFGSDGHHSGHDELKFLM